MAAATASEAMVVVGSKGDLREMVAAPSSTGRANPATRAGPADAFEPSAKIARNHGAPAFSARRRARSLRGELARGGLALAEQGRHDASQSDPSLGRRRRWRRGVLTGLCRRPAPASAAGAGRAGGGPAQALGPTR